MVASLHPTQQQFKPSKQTQQSNTKTKYFTQTNESLNTCVYPVVINDGSLSFPYWPVYTSDNCQIGRPTRSRAVSRYKTVLFLLNCSLLYRGEGHVNTIATICGYVRLCRWHWGMGRIWLIVGREFESVVNQRLIVDATIVVIDQNSSQ